MQALQVPQRSLAGASTGSGRSVKQFAEHEQRARARVDQVRVLADPAETRVARERLFHDRRRIDERAVAEGADLGFQHAPPASRGAGAGSCGSRARARSARRSPACRRRAPTGAAAASGAVLFMRTLMTRSVPGTSSAGRLRRRPCRAMYCMPPWRPSAIQRSSLASSSGELDARDAHLVEAEFGGERSQPRSQFCELVGGEIAGHGGGRAGAASIIARMESLPALVYAAAQVRAMDRHAIEVAGIPGYTLMQRAGVAALELLRQQWPDAQSRHGAVRRRQQCRRRLCACALRSRCRPCTSASARSSIRCDLSRRRGARLRGLHGGGRARHGIPAPGPRGKRCHRRCAARHRHRPAGRRRACATASMPSMHRGCRCSRSTCRPASMPIPVWSRAWRSRRRARITFVALKAGLYLGDARDQGRRTCLRGSRRSRIGTQGARARLRRMEGRLIEEAAAAAAPLVAQGRSRPRADRRRTSRCRVPRGSRARRRCAPAPGS